MSLILTRRVGESLLYRKPDPDGTTCHGRIYVVGIEGNTVRLALDAPQATEIIREELLDNDAARAAWFTDEPRRKRA